ncbi:hypothetical protein ILUMI_05892, partial [Ignelater luminosus]
MEHKETDITSALSKIIEEVLRYNPEVTELTTWSDSYVPQNKNSIMSLAMGRIIANHPELQKITMKYSAHGHSAVQEVDAVHSTIEKASAAQSWFVSSASKPPPSFCNSILLRYLRKQENHSQADTTMIIIMTYAWEDRTIRFPSITLSSTPRLRRSSASNNSSR